ncbi:hypothetical protein TNCV_453761 [Trichonephila clavipes]|nr:hypothetical protein TNCV_453761 [Trichonephila clavipes]
MLIEEWALLSQELLDNLVLNMKRRCEATIASRCRNCGGGDRGRVAIYRPFGELRRAKIVLSPVWCSRPTTGVPLAHATMNFVGLDLTASDRHGTGGERYILQTPVLVVSTATTHKTFEPIDLTSTFSVSIRRVFGGTGIEPRPSVLESDALTTRLPTALVTRNENFSLPCHKKFISKTPVLHASVNFAFKAVFNTDSRFG